MGPGYAFAVPALEGLRKAPADAFVEAEALRDVPGGLTVGDEPVDGVTEPAAEEAAEDGHPAYRPGPRADVAEHHPHHRQPHLVDPVAVAADLPVVPEPVRQLVRIRDAPDPGQQRDVESRRLLVHVEAGQSGQPATDDGLAEHVLLGQSQPEIGRQRKGRDHLSQLHRRARSHRGSLAVHCRGCGVAGHRQSCWCGAKARDLGGTDGAFSITAPPADGGSRDAIPASERVPLNQPRCPRARPNRALEAVRAAG